MLKRSILLGLLAGTLLAAFSISFLIFAGPKYLTAEVPAAQLRAPGRLELLLGHPVRGAQGTVEVPLGSELRAQPRQRPLVERVVSHLDLPLAAQIPTPPEPAVEADRGLVPGGRDRDQVLDEVAEAMVLLLERSTALLRPADLAVVEELLRNSRTWALVDGLAVHVAGDLVERYPDLAGTLDRWAVDEDAYLKEHAHAATGGRRPPQEARSRSATASAAWTRRGSTRTYVLQRTRRRHTVSDRWAP